MSTEPIFTVSIFGDSYPQFVYHYGLEDQAIVLLPNWRENSNKRDSKELITESELLAKRSIYNRGGYRVIEGSLFIYKLLSSGIGAVKTKYDEVMLYDNKDVVFYNHIDGNPYKDLDGNPALFRLTVEPGNLNTLDYRDVLLLTFRSLTEAFPDDTGTSF